MLAIQEKMYWVWLSRIPRIGTKTIEKLLKRYKSLEEIYKLDIDELITNENIGEKLAKTIISEEYRQDLDKYIEYMEKQKINMVTINDEEYPENLRVIDDHPMYLYTKGNIELLNKKAVAIVGTRNCTNYGKKVAYDMASKLVRSNIVVISGLAKGIDTFSHIGTLNKKASTIAVLGSGIDEIYPKENKKLAQEILNKEGLIISEYIMGSKIEKTNFPARNRIISGISSGVLVVEAPRRSGALITADFALEQGKEVFAIPGNINNIFSKGTNQLLKEGAKLVDNIEDILLEL